MSYGRRDQVAVNSEMIDHLMAIERLAAEAFVAYLWSSRGRISLLKMLNSGATVTPTPGELAALIDSFVNRCGEAGSELAE